MPVVITSIAKATHATTKNMPVKQTAAIALMIWSFFVYIMLQSLR